MGISCQHGSPFSVGARGCRRDGSRDFGGIVNSRLQAFEARVLQRHFGVDSLRRWEATADYHSYHLVNVLHPRTTASLGQIWIEYARRPAPTLTTRSRPIVGGEVSFAATVATVGRAWLPLVGGRVRHYVDRPNDALINATEQPHVLHPGYILRWIARAGAMVLSHTVGRGIGMMPRVNENLGLEIFDELDEDIARAIRNL